jgi:hypothetical protein
MLIMVAFRISRGVMAARPDHARPGESGANATMAALPQAVMTRMGLSLVPGVVVSRTLVHAMPGREMVSAHRLVHGVHMLTPHLLRLPLGNLRLRVERLPPGELGGGGSVARTCLSAGLTAARSL